MAKFSSGLRSAMLSQGSLKSLIDGHVLRIYEGEVPISADSALGNAVLLMELTVDGGGGGFTFAAGPGDVTLRQTVGERWETLSVTASGAMSFFRLVRPNDSGSNDSGSLRIQGSIGRSFGHDMAVSTLNTLVGQPWLLNSFYAEFPSD